MLRGKRLWAILVAALGCLLLAPVAGAVVGQSEIDGTVAAGAAWLRSQQGQSGLIRGFGGDWATTTLAAAGVNAADVRSPGALGSLQDYWALAYAEPDWAELPSPIGPGQIGKAALIAWSAGLAPTRISADVNLAADLASIYDWNTGSYGGTKSSNALGFALLGMPYLGLPAGITGPATQVIFANQRTDGGWTYEEGGTAPGDIDMTGAALAMVCSNGFGPDDPRVAAGLGFLRGLENESTGALEGHTPGVPAVNAPSIAWALIGIQACGEDPRGPNWTTPKNANPVEFALSLAVTSGAQAGAIRYEPSSTPTDVRNVNATEELVRALAGKLFSADPPPREDAAQPAVRPAPEVAAGTIVPIALTVESGSGPARMCAVRVANGTPLVEALRSAEANSAPAGCVVGVRAQGPWVTSLDGAAATDPAGGWIFSTPGSAERRVGAQPVGFGDVVRLRLEQSPLPGALYATPTGLDFGGIVAGGSDTRSVTVSSAFAPVDIQTLAPSGSNAFSVASSDCVGRSLAPGSSCTVTVRYAPGAAGSHRGALTVDAAGGAEPAAVALSGSASPRSVPPPPAAKLAPPRITRRHGTVTIGRGGIAVIARLVCPMGPACQAKAPRRVPVTVVGPARRRPRFSAVILVPPAIAPGSSVPVRVRLSRLAVAALRGDTASLSLNVRISSAAGATARHLRTRLRGRSTAGQG